MKVACIGSRELSTTQLQVCEVIGRFIANLGGEVHSGNADGADGAFARGANSVDPNLVHLHLPWPNFNREAIRKGNHVHLPLAQSHFEATAAKYHPRWDNLSQGAKKLHTRNVSIVVHPSIKDLVLAWPSNRVGGGGTGQGMRIAEGKGVDLVDLKDFGPKELHDLCERIRALA